MRWDCSKIIGGLLVLLSSLATSCTKSGSDSTPPPEEAAGTVSGGGASSASFGANLVNPAFLEEVATKVESNVGETGYGDNPIRDGDDSSNTGSPELQAARSIQDAPRVAAREMWKLLSNGLLPLSKYLFDGESGLFAKYDFYKIAPGAALRFKLPPSEGYPSYADVTRYASCDPNGLTRQFRMALWFPTTDGTLENRTQVGWNDLDALPNDGANPFNTPCEKPADGVVGKNVSVTVRHAVVLEDGNRQFITATYNTREKSMEAFFGLEQPIAGQPAATHVIVKFETVDGVEIMRLKGAYRWYMGALAGAKTKRAARYLNVQDGDIEFFRAAFELSGRQSWVQELGFAREDYTSSNQSALSPPSPWFQFRSMNYPKLMQEVIVDLVRDKSINTCSTTGTALKSAFGSDIPDYMTKLPADVCSRNSIVSETWLRQALIASCAKARETSTTFVLNLTLDGAPTQFDICKKIDEAGILANPQYFMVVSGERVQLDPNGTDLVSYGHMNLQHRISTDNINLYPVGRSTVVWSNGPLSTTPVSNFADAVAP